jgi:ribonuclease P protein component
MKKEFRVKKSSEIEGIIKLKQSVGNRHFVIYKKQNHENKHFRAAISVSKKFGNAVQRNKIKRQVRQIIGRFDILPNMDIFVVCKNAANQLSFSEIEQSLTALVNRLKILR